MGLSLKRMLQFICKCEDRKMKSAKIVLKEVRGIRKSNRGIKSDQTTLYTYMEIHNEHILIKKGKI
jgi:hypothetical protein